MTNCISITNPIKATLFPKRGFRAVRHSAFTLIELCMAMAITILVIGVAVLSISGVRDEDKLRRAAAIIETTARQNLLQALNSQQTVRMELTSGTFGTSEEFSGMLQVRRVGENVFRAPKRGESWEFSPTGICEPIEVRLSGEAGQIEIGFDPLTACAKRKSIQVKG
jgi:type II secretory pathway pseudopilin PulG